jgi:hypothetical protein
MNNTKTIENLNKALQLDLIERIGEKAYSAKLVSFAPSEGP